MLELPNKAASQGREQAAVTGITKRSGNVFADLGFQDAEMHALKAKLVRRIGELIAENSLTQVEAAARMGPKMLRGQFRPLSLERLLRCLAALGQSVTLEFGQAPQRGARRRAGCQRTRVPPNAPE